MESVLGRYKNIIVLVGVLFVQVLGLAVQVKRTTNTDSSRLIRIWAVDSITPFERAIVGMQNGVTGIWHNYLYLRGVRQENRDLKEEIQQLRLEQARLNEDAQQARRLQSLLGFKEQYIAKTLAAQVIGSSGSEQSRSVYIDKGSKDGIDRDMAVVTADGVVGKVLRTYNHTSQVLLINDQMSGVGTILEKSRLQGVVRGSTQGDLILDKIMNDEQVQNGEKVLTSGGDQIFPKGMAVGVVTKAAKGPEAFLDVRVRPAADLSRLEEVLVITQKEDRVPEVSETGPVRAVDILAERLPSVPPKPPQDAKTGVGTVMPTAANTKPAVNTAGASAVKPGTAIPTKPANSANNPANGVTGAVQKKAVLAPDAGTQAAPAEPEKPQPPPQSNPPAQDQAQ
jgi:rod shape-determining protein MreC